MQKILTTKDVIALAQLAHIKLSPSQIVQYQKELSEILKYMELLNDVDTRELLPTSQVTGLENVVREDEVQEQLVTPSQLLDGVPRSRDGFIQVKRML